MSQTWTLADLVAEAETRLEALPTPKNGQVRAVPDDRTIRYYATLGLLDRPAAMRGRTAFYGPRHLAQIVAIKRMQSAGHSLADIQQMWPTLDDVTLMRISGVKIPGLATAVTAPIAVEGKRGSRKDFWRREVDASAPPPTRPPVTPYRYRAPPANVVSPPPSPFAPTPSPIEIPAPPYAPFDPSVPLEIPPPLPARPSPFTQSSPVPLPHIPPDVEPPHAPVELRIELAPGVAVSIALAEDAPVSLSPADIRALRAAAASLVTELANRGLTARAPGTMEEKP